MPDSPSWPVPGDSMSTVTPWGVRTRVHSTGMRTMPGRTDEIRYSPSRCEPRSMSSTRPLSPYTLRWTWQPTRPEVALITLVLIAQVKAVPLGRVRLRSPSVLAATWGVAEPCSWPPNRPATGAGTPAPGEAPASDLMAPRLEELLPCPLAMAVLWVRLSSSP